MVSRSLQTESVIKSKGPLVDAQVIKTTVDDKITTCISAYRVEAPAHS